MSNAASGASRPRVTVVIPTPNEARNLPNVFPGNPDGLHEVIVVDAHSVSKVHVLSDSMRVLRAILAERYYTSDRLMPSEPFCPATNLAAERSMPRCITDSAALRESVGAFNG